MTALTYKPEDVAQMLQITRTKVLRYAAAGRFPHLKFGQEVRFTQAHVDAILAGHEVTPTPAAVTAGPWGHRSRSTRRAS